MLKARRRWVWSMRRTLDAPRGTGGQRAQPAGRGRRLWRAGLAGRRSAAETREGRPSSTRLLTGRSDTPRALSPAGLRGSIWIVRAAANRKPADGTKLFDALTDAPCLSTSEVRVAPRGPGGEGRTAMVELRAKRVHTARPELTGPRGGLPQDHRAQPGRRVSIPAGETPLLWRLLTTHPVADAVQAEEIVQLYRLRWRIEQTFRDLISDGLALEADSQILEPGANVQPRGHGIDRREPEPPSSSTP